MKYFLILCRANLVENLDESVKLDGPRVQGLLAYITTGRKKDPLTELDPV